MRCLRANNDDFPVRASRHFDPSRRFDESAQSTFVASTWTCHALQSLKSRIEHRYLTASFLPIYRRFRTTAVPVSRPFET
jgi:hypothetical protein